MALIVGAEDRANIRKLIVYASDNVFDPQVVIDAAAKNMTAYRDMMAELSVRLAIGFMVTYSHERQPFGLARHISISVTTRPIKVPSPLVVEMILQEFGMGPLKGSVGVWTEDIEDGRKAVNVVQRL